MKKIIALLLALVMVLGLAACGGNTTPETTKAPDTGKETTPATNGGNAEAAPGIAEISSNPLGAYVEMGVAIDHHWFAVHSSSFPYKEYYSHLKRLRGIEGRKGYCECFMIPPEQVKMVQTLEEI